MVRKVVYLQATEHSPPVAVLSEKSESSHSGILKKFEQKCRMSKGSKKFSGALHAGKYLYYKIELSVPFSDGSWSKIMELELRYPTRDKALQLEPTLHAN